MALEAFCLPPLVALRPLSGAAVGRRGDLQSSAFCSPRPAAASIVCQPAVHDARLPVTASAGGPAPGVPAASNGDAVADAAEDDEGDVGAVMSAPTEADAQLLSAAMDGELPAISAALEAGASPSATDSNGRTALHMVAANGLRQAIGDLLERGAEINAADTEGLTPLHMATGYQRPDTVRALLAAGADPDLQSKVGDSAVELAEKVVGVTPEKVFWRRNAKYDTAMEVLGILEELYEYYDDEEAGSDGEGAAAEVAEATATGASGDGTDVKFTVRKRVRAEEAGGEAVPVEAPLPSSSADVQTTVRVRKPQKE